MKIDTGRIAILTLVIGADYKRDLAECLESKRKYAARHGYTYFEGGEEFWDRNRPIAWSKVRFWQEILKTYQNKFDYFWISDADVLITNFDLRLEDHVLPLIPATADIMWNYDACHNLNSGNMIFRPTEWLNKFLEQLWNWTEDIYHIWYENYAMIRLYETDSEAKSKIFTNRQHELFNAYLGGRKGERLWTPGDLLVHFAGVYDGKRIKELVGMITRGSVPRINWFPEDVATDK